MWLKCYCLKSHLIRNRNEYLSSLLGLRGIFLAMPNKYIIHFVNVVHMKIWSKPNELIKINCSDIIYTLYNKNRFDIMNGSSCFYTHSLYLSLCPLILSTKINQWFFRCRNDLTLLCHAHREKKCMFCSYDVRCTMYNTHIECNCSAHIFHIIANSKNSLSSCFVVLLTYFFLFTASFNHEI